MEPMSSKKIRRQLENYFRKYPKDPRIEEFLSQDPCKDIEDEYLQAFVRRLRTREPQNQKVMENRKVMDIIYKGYKTEVYVEAPASEDIKQDHKERVKLRRNTSAILKNRLLSEDGRRKAESILHEAEERVNIKMELALISANPFLGSFDNVTLKGDKICARISGGPEKGKKARDNAARGLYKYIYPFLQKAERLRFAVEGDQTRAYKQKVVLELIAALFRIFYSSKYTYNDIYNALRPFLKTRKA